MSKDTLGADIVACIASGTITDPSEVINAFFQVLNGGPILKEVPSDEEKSAGVGKFYETQDANGNILVTGKIYLYRGKRIRLLREEFGSGNCVDTYYRIYYIDDTLAEKFFCVDGRYSRGVFNGAVYRSELVPE